jgi:quercetin dioxygenase-like cupin family protein
MTTIQASSNEWFVRPAPGVVRFHLDHLQDPIGRFDLPAMERELRGDVALAKEGHSAVTLVKYPDLRVVLIFFRTGGSLAETSTDARISLQTLRGHLELRLPDGPIDIPAGNLVTLEGGTGFGVGARTESALLLTLSWPSDASRRETARKV